MDCSLPGSSVHGIFQARVLEWVAIAFSDPVQDASAKQQQQQKKKKKNPQTQSSADRITTSLSLDNERNNKQTKTQHKSHPIGSLHKPLDQP